MTFFAMLAILAVPFFAIWIMTLRKGACAGGRINNLCIIPNALPIEPRFSGAETIVNRGACLAAADVGLYNAHRVANGPTL